MVTAIPVTVVCGSPALNVSTVGSFHSTPRCCLMRSITSCAVIFFASLGSSAVLAQQFPASSSAIILNVLIFMVHSQFVFPNSLGHYDKMTGYFQRNFRRHRFGSRLAVAEVHIHGNQIF